MEGDNKPQKMLILVRFKNAAWVENITLGAKNRCDQY